jgi:hypothetical protein
MQSPTAHPLTEPHSSSNESCTESSFVLIQTELWKRAPKEVLSPDKAMHCYYLLYTVLRVISARDLPTLQ